MQGQDWEPVVLRKKSAPPTEVRARPQTAPVKRKLDQNLEGFDHKKVSKAIADAIQQKRLELGMTQAQLAQKINEKPAVVNDVENCRGVYDHVRVNKILKALGLSLTKICTAQPRAVSETS